MSTNMRQDDGGLTITPQMQKILDQRGFISVKKGSEKLRSMFQEQFGAFDPSKLSPFALACTCGHYDEVKKAVDSGTAPELTATQTPFQLGFLALTVLGAKGIQSSTPGVHLRHRDVLTCLIDAGAPLDLRDVVGHTALHHACTPPNGRAELVEVLLDRGADVNAQTRYGEVPICFPFQGGDVRLVDRLMAHGADLDLPDANGDAPRRTMMLFGPEITAVVQRWERKRRGEDPAPYEEKRCEHCKAKGSGLKMCARCHIVRYCSTECQRAHWKTHKPHCNPFSAETTVTLKPTYTGPDGASFSSTISMADLTRQAFGLAKPSTRLVKPGFTKNEAENKSMVIKIQVPVTPLVIPNMPQAPLLIYNKKRDFGCTVERASNPQAYDAVVHTVRTRGVGGAKAYFAAELKNPDALVVKISEVLAEQPF